MDSERFNTIIKMIKSSDYDTLSLGILMIKQSSIRKEFTQDQEAFLKNFDVKGRYHVKNLDRIMSPLCFYLTLLKSIEEFRTKNHRDRKLIV